MGSVQREAMTPGQRSKNNTSQFCQSATLSSLCFSILAVVKKQDWQCPPHTQHLYRQGGSVLPKDTTAVCICQNQVSSKFFFFFLFDLSDLGFGSCGSNKFTLTSHFTQVQWLITAQLTHRPCRVLFCLMRSFWWWFRPQKTSLETQNLAVSKWVLAYSSSLRLINLWSKALTFMYCKLSEMSYNQQRACNVLHYLDLLSKSDWCQCDI